jgi:hypothetical protein
MSILKQDIKHGNISSNSKKNLLKNYILILFVLATKCLSQSLSDREIFQYLLNEKKDSIFTVSKQSDGYKRLKEVVSKKIIYNKNFSEQSLTLTNKEVSYIIAEINKNNSFNFSEKTFPNAIIISKDTIQSYSSNKAKNWEKTEHSIIESNDTIKIFKFRTERPYSYIETYVHFFSKPIYFRNGSFCILHHAELCCFHNGMCGCNSTYIFKKNNNTWEKFIEITHGCY